MRSNLLMPFKDQSHSFTNGFECGQYWQRLNNGDQITGELAHRENVEQLSLVAEHFGYEFHSNEYDSTWCYVSFLKLNKN